MKAPYRYKGKEYARFEDLPSKVCFSTFYTRVTKRGWSVELAVDTPKVEKTYLYNGKRYLLKQLPTDAPYHVMYDRIVGKKWPVKKAVETPWRPYKRRANGKNFTGCPHKNEDFDSLRQCCRICGAPRLSAPESPESVGHRTSTSACELHKDEVDPATDDSHETHARVQPAADSAGAEGEHRRRETGDCAHRL